MEKNVEEKVLIGRPLASIDSIVSHYCNDNFLAFYISNNKAHLNFKMRNQQKIKLTKRKTCSSLVRSFAFSLMGP